ncbi:MAG TPA: protein kinase [Labilithrix sp.]|nr:protein kinase [Labilithrix sp.]
MTDLSDTSPVKEGDIVADKFRIERRLGIGGMGVVYAATHIHLGKRVAIKTMLSNALGIPMAVERFEREARATVQLRGDHIAQVLDVGKLPSGIPYLVMELLDGDDLGTIVDSKGALPIEDAVDFVIQACEAVAEAHTQGIVHRDLKPRNLFLTRHLDGTPLVKVLDFGISKWAQGTEDHSLTRTSDIVGSPNYMSPEQIKSAKDVDARTDIWSLGVILHELIAGRVPFLATGVPQLCAMVLQDAPPSLVELRPDTPISLANTVTRCLEKDRADRFQTVGELVRALEPHAPQRSRVSIDRVRLIARPSSSQGLPPSSTSAAKNSARVHVSNGTSVSWADTVVAGVNRKWTPSLVVVVGIAAAIGIGGLFALRGATREHAGLVMTPTPEPVSAASDLPKPPSRVANLKPPLAESAPPADGTLASASAVASNTKPALPTAPTKAAHNAPLAKPSHSQASSALAIDAGAPPVVRPEDVLTPGDRK